MQQTTTGSDSRKPGPAQPTPDFSLGSWTVIQVSQLGKVFHPFSTFPSSRLKFHSVAQSCPTLCNPMDWSMPGLPVLQPLPELDESVMLSKHLILCCPLLFLPSIYLSIRVFSNKSALCIRWPKCWWFSLSISFSSEYSGLISFRMD